MATKFPPGQDMENISPKDLEEAKKYTKERKAYKDSSKIGPDMADKKPKEKPQETNYLAERSARIKKAEDEGREYGRTVGRERQEEADRLGGPLGTPAAYVKRAGQYIGDKITDADAYLSEKTGMQERAAARRGERAGLKEEGYAKGGMTASSRADGCCTKGKTRGMIR